MTKNNSIDFIRSVFESFGLNSMNEKLEGGGLESSKLSYIGKDRIGLERSETVNVNHKQ